MFSQNSVKTPTSIDDQTIRLVTPTGELFGTLTIPAGRSANHVTLIIAGSGPTDRNGNSTALPGKNNSLKLLAEELAQAGIASLRTDKRGVGASAAAAPSESDIHFETFVDDAVAWLERLEAYDQFEEFSIIGHSEGSLIGMLAAQVRPIDAFVSLEGAGQTAQAILLTQLSSQLPEPLLAEVRRTIKQLASGQLVDPLPPQISAEPALAKMFRAGLQPFLISWFRYDPAVVLAKLKIPILVVQGTTDLQVNEKDANRLADANPRARLLMIKGMNHILKFAPKNREENVATYSQPDLPLARDLVPAISHFLNSVEIGSPIPFN